MAPPPSARSALPSIPPIGKGSHVGDGGQGPSIHPPQHHWPFRHHITSSLRAAGMDERADRIERCCTSSHVRQADLNDPSTARLILHHCDDALCRPCHDHRTRKTRKALLSQLQSAQRRAKAGASVLVFVTLTGRVRFEADEYRLCKQYFYESSARWLRMAEVKNRIVGGFIAYECEWNAEREAWHGHLHLALELDGYWPTGTRHPVSNELECPDTKCGAVRVAGWRREYCRRCQRLPMAERRNGCGKAYGLRDTWRLATARAARAMFGGDADDSALGAYVVDVRRVSDVDGAAYELTKYLTKEAGLPAHLVPIVAEQGRSIQRFRWRGSWYAPTEDAEQRCEVESWHLFGHGLPPEKGALLPPRLHGPVRESQHTACTCADHQPKAVSYTLASLRNLADDVGTLRGVRGIRDPDTEALQAVTPEEARAVLAVLRAQAQKEQEARERRAQARAQRAREREARMVLAAMSRIVAEAEP